MPIRLTSFQMPLKGQSFWKRAMVSEEDTNSLTWPPPATSWLRGPLQTQTFSFLFARDVRLRRERNASFWVPLWISHNGDEMLMMALKTLSVRELPIRGRMAIKWEQYGFIYSAVNTHACKSEQRHMDTCWHKSMDTVCTDSIESLVTDLNLTFVFCMDGWKLTFPVKQLQSVNRIIMDKNASQYLSSVLGHSCFSSLFHDKSGSRSLISRKCLLSTKKHRDTFLQDDAGEQNLTLNSLG